LIVNLILCAVLELGSGFVNDFHTFLAVRSLFGIAMGGIWGLAASTALENLPVELRGLASGVLQQGYAVGYLLAAVINLYLVPKTSWRSLFWTAAGISAFAAFVRLLTPESSFFIQAHEAERRRIANGGAPRVNKTRIFLHETKQMLKKHWRLCIYAVLLMTGEQFLFSSE
jgi:MFS transporter, SHS family, lactate transporter